MTDFCQNILILSRDPVPLNHEINIFSRLDTLFCPFKRAYRIQTRARCKNIGQKIIDRYLQQYVFCVGPRTLQRFYR